VRRYSIVVIGLALFSLIDGYLLSAISFAGRAGISLFYTQYQFLKSWWKDALLVFIFWIILLAIESMVSKKVSKATAAIVQISLLIIAIAGLYLSYADFQNSLSHRLLGERFHLGVYVFWLGWIAISIFILLQKKIDLKEELRIENVH
jgi:hypothetical protein